MATSALLKLLFAIFLVAHLHPSANCLVNNRPVLGVLLLENADKSGQFIGASYVKFLESAGARVVSCERKFDLCFDCLTNHLFPLSGAHLFKAEAIVLPGNGLIAEWHSHAWWQQQRHSL